MIANHEWRLVAPWYHWQRQLDAEQRQPWQTRPVFQKFDQTDFVKTFTADPQRSLRFLENEDTVFDTSLKEVAKISSGPLVNRFTQLYAPKKPGGAKADSAQEATLVPTGTRKLYLATHKRNYLVVSELHCYAPGFPKVKADQVCQAGFVVRRRALSIPAAQQTAAHKAAAQILKEINSVKSDLAYWQQTTPATGLGSKRRKQAVQKAVANGTYAGIVKDLQTKLSTAQKKLTDWRATYQVTATLEGWIPGKFENIGSWQAVEGTPKQTHSKPFPTDEATFPLFALFPDPKIPGHSARGRNIYFGVVPTSSLDTDQFGVPRFDSDVAYEIRCFVRRHKTDCPKTDKKPDCHGEIVWSEATETYKLASATDLNGTSNRPITIKLPDFKELAAQAASLPANKLAPVRMIQPQSMKFSVDDGKATGGGIGGFQICFFSIPLITIVAMFLLQLFLPIVVFLFGLFFLLALKFCIPPSLSVAAGADLSAKLDLAMPKLEADASLDIDIGLDAALGIPNFTADFNATMTTGIIQEHSIVKADDKTSLQDFSNAAFLPLGVGMNEAGKLTDAEGLPKPEAGLDLTASLELEPRVEVTVK
ncbi:MAG TPA: hypothetical protein VHQ64_14630 [Pyrinomonadaceae bacterium]|jgi:hypothetical protein|nr:hypothetical protein [Pyrinomonadaceae bacterium]